MNMRTSLLAVLLSILIPAGLFAAGATKEELRKRFQERYPQIQQLKSDGVIGETDEGYVDFVEKKTNADLVEQENSDRRELYALIAKDTKESPDTVAKQSAQRNFKKAKTGEYLKVGGKWHKKADETGAGDDQKDKKKPKKSGG